MEWTIDDENLIRLERSPPSRTAGRSPRSSYPASLSPLRGKVGALVRNMKNPPSAAGLSFRRHLGGVQLFWKDARWTHSHLVLESFNPLFKSVKTMYLVFNRLQMVLELGLHIR